MDESLLVFPRVLSLGLRGVGKFDARDGRLIIRARSDCQDSFPASDEVSEDEDDFAPAAVAGEDEAHALPWRVVLEAEPDGGQVQSASTLAVNL